MYMAMLVMLDCGHVGARIRKIHTYDGYFYHRKQMPIVSARTVKHLPPVLWAAPSPVPPLHLGLLDACQIGCTGCQSNGRAQSFSCFRYLAVIILTPPYVHRSRKASHVVTVMSILFQGITFSLKPIIQSLKECVADEQPSIQPLSGSSYSPTPSLDTCAIKRRQLRQHYCCWKTPSLGFLQDSSPSANRWCRPRCW
jgi:hypothetical protein